MATETFISLTTELQQFITSDQAWHFGIVPKEVNDHVLHFYFDESRKEQDIKDELGILFDADIILHKTPAGIINETLSRYYRRDAGKKTRVSTFNRSSDTFLEEILYEAKSVNSSDIHLERYEDRCRVRLRIDGKLVERYVITKTEYPAIVNKIKILANLDIAEKRLPQDGRIQLKNYEEKTDVRVSVLPTMYGEKIVLRILSKDTTHIELESLGFKEQQLQHYLEGIKKPHGIVLISGPTGSGKTTTLYATLKLLNKQDVNLLTIEDPIEYTLEGVNQVQLNEAIGLSFSRALRTFLRQDPDIIMLGEIRDTETAQMAIRAALTGHLVFSTIHTNSAWGIVSRLIDMGLPPFLVAGTMNLAISQRLVRLLCPECKREEPFDPGLLPPHYKAPATLKKHFTAQGCEHCYYTGYKGRSAVYEVIPVDSVLSEYIKQKEFSAGDHLKEKNITLISDAAFELLAEGKTSIEEIYPVLISNESE